VQLSRRHGTATQADSPLCRPTTGSLHLTTHHAIFEPDKATEPSDQAEVAASGSGLGRSKSENEVWVSWGPPQWSALTACGAPDMTLPQQIPLALLHSVTRTPPSLTGDPSPILLRTRLFESFELAFASLADADNVWDTLKGLCSSFASGGLENRYAFFCGDVKPEDKKGKGKAGWDIYDPAAEFARMGLGTRSKAWRTTTLNADFQVRDSPFDGARAL
jgi:myotubularin-related protein 6/7/8